MVPILTESRSVMGRVHGVVPEAAPRQLVQQHLRLDENGRRRPLVTIGEHHRSRSSKVAYIVTNDLHQIPPQLAVSFLHITIMHASHCIIIS